jgi:predicted secreted hydrolase
VVAIGAGWAIVPGPAAGAKGFAAAEPGYRYVFPRDHGPHPTFQTEWWYYTGRLTAESGRTYGYQLTFFRRGIDAVAVRNNPSRGALKNVFLAHFAITDDTQQKFLYAEKANRPGVPRPAPIPSGSRSGTGLGRPRSGTG